MFMFYDSVGLCYQLSFIAFLWARL